MYLHLPTFPGDPILSLHEAFMRDTTPGKVSLGIGMYFDDAGRLPVLASVQAAAQRLAETPQPAGYLPIDGLPGYCASVGTLVFGADSKALADGRIATVQTPGGSGGLHLAARFIKRLYPESQFFLSDPTWDNHFALIEAAGCKTGTYPYYDKATNAIDFSGMLAAMQAMPADSVVLLQPCCHNPTGLDVSREQWQKVFEVLAERRLIPLLDMAYQGFGNGLDEDAWAIRAMVAAGLMPLVTGSFSKNFSLYGERVGWLSVVCPTSEEAALVLGQLKVEVRGTWSTPPSHGAKLVATVLGDEELRAQWTDEVATMRNRMRQMREVLKARLNAKAPGHDFGYLTTQQGMFSYTGLPLETVEALRRDHAVYLTNTGRMCVAGLSVSNVMQVGEAIAAVMTRHPVEG